MPRNLRFALLTVTALVACSSEGPPPDVTVTAAASWPEADALFRRGSPAFLGADAAYSIDLHDGRVLWLFGDTFVAKTAANVRGESEMVRNTVAIQTGLDPLTATFEPAWRTGADATPASFFPEETRADGERWHWPGHGVRIPDGPLVIFLSILRATPGEGLGFAGDGWRLAIVDDPSGPPSSWIVRTVDPPAQSLDAVVGTAVAVDGDDVLALAAADGGSHATYLVRFPRAALAQGDLTQIVFTGPLFDDAATEASLHFDPALGHWLYVYSRGFGGTTLAMRTALAPEGPWSGTRDVFTPPESRGDDPFVYAGKAHPELDAGGDLAITYATNSFDFEDLFTPDGMRVLYWPRFVRVATTTVADE
jgi:hypothetical protein